MKRSSQARLFIRAVFLASFAAIALSVAAPTATNGARTYYFVGGHAFGIGEQQVYLIERHAQLTVRYRDAMGALKSQTFRQNAKASVAWTIEGISSSGGPVLGVATAAPTASGSAAPTAPTYTPESSHQSPSPSPVLDSQGAAAPLAAMTDIAPASLILSSIARELPDVGKPWESSGDVRLPYGMLTLRSNNVVNAAAGDQDANVVQITSNGTASYQAKVYVGGFGAAKLRGAGTTSGITFIESKNKLLLGTTIAAASHGNANAKERRGVYDLTVSIAIKLVRYVPGIPPYVGSPGFVPASGYLGSTTAPDTQIYSTTVPDKLAVPAPTDTGFIPPMMPPVTPYPSALPEMSLPPIPIPVGSDQPMASPPAPPTPTPTPTRY